MTYNISVDKETCIGCGACASTCDNFKLKDGKAQPKESSVKDVGCNQEAADLCPVQAIKVEKK